MDEVEPEISWLVSNEQITYLPKPKAQANKWSPGHWDKSRYFVINEFNNCLINSITKSVSIFKLLSDSSGKTSASFHTRACVQLRMSRILFEAKTHLDGITHEQTIIYRSRRGFSANEKERKNASNDKVP